MLCVARNDGILRMEQTWPTSRNIHSQYLTCNACNISKSQCFHEFTFQLGHIKNWKDIPYINHVTKAKKYHQNNTCKVWKIYPSIIFAFRSSKKRIAKIQTSKCINKIQFCPSITGLNSFYKRNPNPNDDELQMRFIIYLHEPLGIWFSLIRLIGP